MIRHLFLAGILCLSVKTYSQTSPDLLKHEAEKNMTSGRYGEAINLLSELLSDSPNSPDGYALRGECYEKRSQLKFALIDFRKASKLTPQNPKYKNAVDRVKKKYLASINKKINNYKRELLINPRLSQNYYLIAQFYEELDDWKEAEKWYEEYFGLTDASPEKVIRYSEILSSNNEIKKGEKLLKQYSNRYSNDHRIVSRLGYFLLWMGKYREAVNTFERALAIKPFYKEAQDGLSQARGDNFLSPTALTPQQGTGLTKTDNIGITRNKRQKLQHLLTLNPQNQSIRFSMIRELINGRQFDEAVAHSEIYLKNGGGKDVARVAAMRDSLYQILIVDYERKFDYEPSNRELALKLSGYYSNFGDYNSSIDLMRIYFENVPMESDPEMAFRFAQYSAWSGKLQEAEQALKLLLTQEPYNLDYQLLLGQVLVWGNNDLEIAQKHLEQVRKQRPRDIYAILTLSSLHITKHQLEEAKDYLNLAKKIAPDNPEIPNVEKYFETAEKENKKLQIYAILEEGRQFVAAGKCEQALEKYELYFTKTLKPERAVLVEYADVQTCSKNLENSIEIYNELLAEQYDYDIAVRRAKNYLWVGRTDDALSELKTLSIERPDDFESRLFLGDTYLKLKKFSKAKAVYNDLLGDELQPEQIKTVESRYKYLPQSGLLKTFSTFPQPIAFNPIANQYTDNQDFRLRHMGGIVNIGITTFITGGASLVKATINSANDTRDLTVFKGRLYIKPVSDLSIGGGVGVLNTFGQISRSVSDLSIDYRFNQTLSTNFYYENTDAALILYSPYLLNVRQDINFFKVSGNYENKSKLKLSSSFSYFSISDGNAANDVMVKVGKELWDKITLGYESQYQNYKYLSPFLPGSNGTQRLYYSPQNLNSHSIWAEWVPDSEKNLDLTFNAKIGYVPELDILLRQVNASFNLNATKSLIINAKTSIGSSYRFDSSYNFFSASLSAYWRLY